MKVNRTDTNWCRNKYHSRKARCVAIEQEPTVSLCVTQPSPATFTINFFYACQDCHIACLPHAAASRRASVSIIKTRDTSSSFEILNSFTQCAVLCAATMREFIPLIKKIWFYVNRHWCDEKVFFKRRRITYTQYFCWYSLLLLRAHFSASKNTILDTYIFVNSPSKLTLWLLSQQEKKKNRFSFSEKTT